MRLFFFSCLFACSIYIPIPAFAATIIFPGSDPVVTVKVELATTAKEHARGLMFREAIDSGKGMFFIFEKKEPLKFWMKNVSFPIDIIFIDEKFKIKRIIDSAVPCLKEPCITYDSFFLVRYVLEVSARFCKRNGVKVGDSVKYLDNENDK